MKILKTYESFEPEEYWEEELDNVFVFDHRIYKREEIPFNIGDKVSIEYKHNGYMINRNVIISHIHRSITGEGYWIMLVSPSNDKNIFNYKSINGSSKVEIRKLSMNESFEPEEEWEEEDDNLIPKELEFFPKR